MDDTPSGPEAEPQFGLGFGIDGQDWVPSEVFVQTLTSLIDKDDVRCMVDDQRHMLSRFEKTNEMLLNFNVLSSNRYAASVQEFKKHTLLLIDMKKDLDSVFRRIRTLKQTLSKQYPQAFSACSDVYNILETTEEDEGSVVIPVPTLAPGHEAEHLIEIDGKTCERQSSSDSMNIEGHSETSDRPKCSIKASASIS